MDAAAASSLWATDIIVKELPFMTSALEEGGFLGKADKVREVA